MCTANTSNWGDMNLSRFTQACAGRRAASLWLGAAASALGCATCAMAADDKADGPPTGIPTPSIATSLPKQGDPFGSRAALAGIGITGGVNYIGEVLGNASGGVKRGGIYEGRLELYGDIDFDKLAGWKGLTFHANAYQIHGQGLTANNVQNLFPVSYIEATPATRLFEAWFEQQIITDKLSVRFGQLAADSEFVTSDTATQFINGTFGWPTSFATSLPSGGPAYPLATPGVRVMFVPTDVTTIRAALFNGDPAGPHCQGDPQRCNDNGLDFRLRDPVLAIAEAQFKYNQDKGSSALPGVVKVGGWKHFGSFADQRFDATGLSLANGLNDPRRHHGNTALYALIDQQIFAGQNGKQVNAFARITASPDDRNPVQLYLDGGLKFAGFVPGRPDDTFGAAVAYARISDAARGLDRDNVAAGNQSVVRNYEAMIELSYTTQIVPGWTLQPDFQYIWHPGAHADDGTGKPIADAAVFGLRTTVNY